MYKRIVVAYNHSAEASRAMAAAIGLARAFGAELDVVCILEDSSAYSGFATTPDSSLAQMLRNDQRERFEQLQSWVRDQELREGVQVVTHIFEGEEVERIAEFALRHRVDLLVVGLHQHSLSISRLWSSVYAVAQAAQCSVLGVH